MYVYVFTGLFLRIRMRVCVSRRLVEYLRREIFMLFCYQYLKMMSKCWLCSLASRWHAMRRQQIETRTCNGGNKYRCWMKKCRGLSLCFSPPEHVVSSSVTQLFIGLIIAKLSRVRSVGRGMEVWGFIGTVLKIGGTCNLVVKTTRISPTSARAHWGVSRFWFRPFHTGLRTSHTSI